MENKDISIFANDIEEFINENINCSYSQADMERFAKFLAEKGYKKSDTVIVQALFDAGIRTRIRYLEHRLKETERRAEFAEKTIADTFGNDIKDHDKALLRAFAERFIGDVCGLVDLDIFIRIGQVADEVIHYVTENKT